MSSVDQILRRVVRVGPALVARFIQRALGHVADEGERELERREDAFERLHGACERLDGALERLASKVRSSAGPTRL